MIRALAVLLLAGALLAAPAVAARPSDLEARVSALEARVTALEEAWPTAAPTPAASASPAPVASATAAPTPTPTGTWTLLFRDDFDTWSPSRYFVYPSTWHDTSGNGWYDPSTISASGGLLRIRLYTDAAGKIHVAAIVPLPEGSLSARGDLEAMRVTFRIRADRMTGYKGVPLLWPIEGHPWPEWGEVNWPESEFDQRPSAFMHRQGATSGSDQDWYPAPDGTSWQDWHTYSIEWVAGQYAEFAIDGAVIGRSTERVPAGAMHLVAQFETNLSGYRPDPAVSGYVEIDWLTVEGPA